MRGAPVPMVVDVTKALEAHGVKILHQDLFNRLVELLGEMLERQPEAKP